MDLTFFGNHPLAKDSSGQLVSRIGGSHPALGILITLPKMNHVLQRIYYTDHLNALRIKQGPKTFSDRWVRVLDRLDRTDVPALIALIRAEIQRQIPVHQTSDANIPAEIRKAPGARSARV